MKEAPIPAIASDAIAIIEKSDYVQVFPARFRNEDDTPLVQAFQQDKDGNMVAVTIKGVRAVATILDEDSELIELGFDDDYAILVEDGIVKLRIHGGVYTKR